jgi:hypothetical protein
MTWISLPRVLMDMIADCVSTRERLLLIERTCRRWYESSSTTSSLLSLDISWLPSSEHSKWSIIQQLLGKRLININRTCKFAHLWLSSSEVMSSVSTWLTLQHLQLDLNYDGESRLSLLYLQQLPHLTILKLTSSRTEFIHLPPLAPLTHLECHMRRRYSGVIALYCDEMPLLTTLITGPFIRFRVGAPPSKNDSVDELPTREEPGRWLSPLLTSLTFLNPILSGYWKPVIDQCQNLKSLTDTSLGSRDLIYLSTRALNLEHLCLNQAFLMGDMLSLQCFTKLREFEMNTVSDSLTTIKWEPLLTLTQLTSIMIRHRLIRSKVNRNDDDDDDDDDGFDEWQPRSGVVDTPSFVRLVITLSSSSHHTLPTLTSSSSPISGAISSHSGQLVRVNGMTIAAYLAQQTEVIAALVGSQ